MITLLQDNAYSINSTNNQNNPVCNGEENFSSEEKGEKRHSENNESGSPKRVKSSTNAQDEYHQPPSESRVSKKWTQIGDIVGGDAKNHDLYDQSVAFSNDGTRFAFGYYTENFACVKVSDFEDGRWKVVGSFDGVFDEDVEDFGWKIALSGNGKVLAIRSRLTDEQCLCSGNVSVYQNTEGANWDLMGCILVGFQPDDWFGESIALSEDGNRIAIGAPGEGDSDNKGVSIFEFDGTNWVSTGQIISGEDYNDNFGSAVSFSADGNTIAIGAPESVENGPSTGSIGVFQYSSFGNSEANSTEESGQWVQVGNTLHGEAAHDLFGYFLSLSAIGDVVTVGAAGGEYVQSFHFRGNEWHQMGGKLLAQFDMEASISLAGNRNRIAVFFQNDDGTNIKIYDYDGNEWIPIGNPVAAPSSRYCRGSSVLLSSSGDHLAIASIHDDGGFVGACKFG